MLKRIIMLYINIAGLLVYLYTIYYAFTISGLIAAILSACLPVVANLYWMYQISTDTGDLFNNYNIACLSVLVGFVVLLLFTDAGSEQSNSKDE